LSASRTVGPELAEELALEAFVALVSMEKAPSMLAAKRMALIGGQDARARYALPHEACRCSCSA
jgi:hypothetical protein